MNIYSIIGIILVGFVGYRFLSALGKQIPILELLLLIAGMQWIVGAFIEYRTDFQHYKYYMYVDELSYMSYVVPAYLFLVLGVYAITRVKSYPIIDISQFSNYAKFGLLLIVIGIMSDAISAFVPSALLFVTYLLSAFKYVGAIILFFSDVRWHRYIFIAAVLYLVLKSLSSGFFHEFILWSTFFYMFWTYKKKPNIKFNITVIVVGFLVGSAIQAVKSDYRFILSQTGADTDYVSVFSQLLSQRISGGLTEDSSQQSELNVRLNQGWIISAIMDNTPRLKAFGEGVTIKEAVYASVLPRFLNPNKTEAGGRDNFQNYTGIALAENTSMGMSIIGESYANYGRFGGVLFMGVWGLFLGYVWTKLQNQIKRKTILLFFLPLIFLQVVKAETELVVVLNHLVKASIIVFGFLWVAQRYLGYKLTNAA